MTKPWDSREKAFFFLIMKKYVSQQSSRKDAYVSKWLHAFLLFAIDEREFLHIIYWKIKREETVFSRNWGFCRGKN